jgi:hypothetical protein
VTLFLFVMPAKRVSTCFVRWQKAKNVDARRKGGHDEEEGARDAMTCFLSSFPRTRESRAAVARSPWTPISTDGLHLVRFKKRGAGVTRKNVAGVVLSSSVMPDLGSGIHVFLFSHLARRQKRTWMAGTSPAMTKKRA